MKLNGPALAAAGAAGLDDDLLDQWADRLACGSAVSGRQMRVEFGDRTAIQGFVIGR
ncbi:hypothetical protein [Sphingomonas sp. 3P27F8]|uniref:hypothetical protein n=1 Tax=Sphingomonas sp. 3P27F8 TaxID=2502213 RepID=UPI002016A6DC|nr:hypothetical protein [Sphingomonas sp. 3P27F8]